MKIFTFDLETENHTSNKRRASPFDARNYIVQAGWSLNGGQPEEQYYDKYHRDPVLPVELVDSLQAGDIINGFNVKFDLLWVWEEPCLQAALKRGVTIYCGQYAEYLMGGMVQEVQMCSMNDIAESYGGGCKIDAVKEMWENGVLTSEVPRDLLTDYLIGDGKEIVGDIHNTWLILLGQIARMKAEHPEEFRTMLKLRMDGLLATVEMEYNGVYIDKAKGELLRTSVAERLELATVELEKFVPELPPEYTFNWGSSSQKSCLIFGGTTKYKKWVAHEDEHGNILYAKKKVKWPLFNGEPLPPEECILAKDLYVLEVPADSIGAWKHNDKYYYAQDTFKGGKRRGEGKFKNMDMPDETKPKGAQKDHYFTFNGYTKADIAWKGESTDAFDNPLYSTGADIIKSLTKRGLPFTDALGKRTKLDKDLGTYYWKEDKSGKRKGMLCLVTEQGIINHKLNVTNTVTSRMSSSDPNLQNVPRGNTSEVKQMFTSRWGEAGLVSEIDYSQLEVVIQGVLSRDVNLMKDLNDRVDFHCKRLAKKLGESYEYVWNKHHVEHDKHYGDMRTDAKSFSFQRAYGAGAATISEDTGIPRSDVDALIAAEEEMYPGVMMFDQMLESTIASSRRDSGMKLFIDGVPFSQGESHFDSPTGTRYKWREKETPQFMRKQGKYVGFSPTERKNYVVQGMGGEIVQTMLGKIFRFMLANDRFGGDVLLVNTVHDCVWLDGVAEKIPAVTAQVKEIMETVPEVFNAAYPNLCVEVPFPCSSEIGPDMFDMTETK